jgi:hypothetical protein
MSEKMVMSAGDIMLCSRESALNLHANRTRSIRQASMVRTNTEAMAEISENLSRKASTEQLHQSCRFNLPK